MHEYQRAHWLLAQNQRAFWVDKGVGGIGMTMLETPDDWLSYKHKHTHAHRQTH